MADVLLVYVQEDRAYAEGIGASLERSGLTVADGDGSVLAGADAPCVLVLWSAHSTRSAIVRDLAIRAQREGKLVTAKLAGCEAPLGFARPAPHDLSRWIGDPDDPQFDSLFFAVDRLVCALRLNARAEPPPPESRARQPIYPQGGHVHNPNVRPLRAGPIASIGPSVARAARVEPDSASHHRAEPALPPNVAEEAVAWKRIEHSTDPKDFLDYLTAFSPNGIFCELAQLKLDKLTPKSKPAFIPHTPSPHVAKPRAAENTRERRAAARSQPPAEPEPPRYAARPEPRPEPRYEAPPEPRYEPRPEPRPEPRYEPRPEARYEPRHEAPYEPPRPDSRYEPRPRPRPEAREDYEFESGPIAPPTRSAANRPRRRAPAPEPVVYEPREGGGLPWRPLLIVALLAAGGVAFFQALPKQAPPSGVSAPVQDLAEASRAAPLNELSSPDVPHAPVASAETAAMGGPNASATKPAARPAPVPAPVPALAERPASPAPTPIISFRPPEPTPTPAPTLEQTAPPVVAATPAPAAPGSSASATPAPQENGFVRPTWLRRPTVSQLSNAYPRRASESQVAGKATLDCLVLNDGSLACTATSASPANFGFAEAAVTVSKAFRAAPTLPDGSSVYGKRAILTISFAPAN
ncbi:MAG TPA: hypothetical protein VG735_15640 [Caulobacterales bacterium]|nr:hypothetical protein [Caulobacterales bacterium]